MEMWGLEKIEALGNLATAGLDKRFDKQLIVCISMHGYVGDLSIGVAHSNDQVFFRSCRDSRIAWIRKRRGLMPWFLIFIATAQARE